VKIKKIYDWWLTSGGSDQDTPDFISRINTEGGALVAGDEDNLRIFRQAISPIRSELLELGFFLGGFNGSKVKYIYADPAFKNLNLSAGSVALTSSDYSESTGLSALAQNRKADTQFTPSSFITKDNFSMSYLSVADLASSNTFLMCNNLVSGAAGMYCGKTTSGLNAAVTPPTNRTITTPQTKTDEPNFRWISSNGKILAGHDYVYQYPIGGVDTPNIDLSTTISMFGGRQSGAAVHGTGRLSFYFIGNYLTYDEICILFQAVEAFLIAKGRITNPAKLLTFGDSVTRGVGASVFTARYSYLLAAAFGLREKNMGIAGGRLAGSDFLTVGGYDRREQLLKYSLVSGSKVVLQYGINDINADGDANGTPALIADFKTKYKTIVTDLLAFGYGVDDIYIGSPGYINNGTSTTKMEAYGTPCMEIAQETGIWYTPIRERMIAAGGNSQLSDTLHPNDAGHATMSDAYVNHSVKIP
jgi:lysophospholipase L1-like esterase